MSFSRRYNNLPPPIDYVLRLALGGLVLSSCGGNSSAPSNGSARATPTTTHEIVIPTATSWPNCSIPYASIATPDNEDGGNDADIPVRFDARVGKGTSSHVVQVYPGPRDCPDDKEFNGTYEDVPGRDEAVADCKVEDGRLLSASADETQVPGEPNSSTTWVRIEGAGGVDTYASPVYLKNGNELVLHLPRC